jgi:hypothetical protein
MNEHGPCEWIFTYDFEWLPSGKRTKNYGKSAFYSWVNQLFNYGHGFQFANCKRVPEDNGW